jgi:uncharacterized membrane protein
MNKTRLEAFSDGVLAIIITIMVLELKVPHGADFASLKPLFSVFLSYILSFIYLGIYWINHHHLLQATDSTNGKILWANLHLLFWLSLIPFSTGWMGENNFAPIPTALYGVNLLFAAIAYSILQSVIIKHHGEDHILAKAVGNNQKGKISMVLYCVGIISTFFIEWVAGICFVVVALIWLILDKRIESEIKA